MFFDDEGKNLRAIAVGDPVAIRQLYEKYKDDIYRYALSITRDAQMAEDILHDTIIKVMENAHSYKGGKVKSWIMRIAHNLAINQIKKHSRELQTEFIAQNDESFTDSFDEIVSLLPDIVDRKIVGLRIDGGFKNTEIAELLGLDHKAVSRRYKNALKLLKSKLK